MENLSKRDHEAWQEAAPGWDDRLADYDEWLNFGPARREHQEQGWLAKRLRKDADRERSD
ncbi:hypothetical protein Q427_14520 [Halomonas sp. BC04]|nr:hypothetical protein Q427_14520 [Halomonas sp. BC04]